MKWFKHMSDAHRDPKLIALVDEFGVEGYGIWWIICEVVADQYKANGTPELETSVKGWRKLTGIYPKKFEKVLTFLEKARLLSVTFPEKGIKVCLPKMQEFKDNHTRNLQVTCKQEVEGDVEEDKKSTLSGTCQQAKPDASPLCPHQEIISIYHEVLPELRKVRVWDGNREKLLRARWKSDSKRQDLDWWRGFFEYVRKCPFLMGLVDGRDGKAPFQADLEWLVRPTNFNKVIEGKYES
mgnify:CR=1 FL=1